MKKENYQRSLLALIALFLAAFHGCMVGPNFKRPKPNAPTKWEGTATTTAAASQPSVATTRPANLAQWWQVFNDETMISLVEQALTTNLDLQAAKARLRQARAQRGVVVGALLPQADAAGTYQRNRPPGTPPGIEQNLYQAGLDASWEIDVFGGLRRGVEAAEANISASREDLRNVQVSLVAEVSLNYVLLRGYQQQIQTALDNLKSQRHTADITRQRHKAGFVSQLDVANAEAQVATTESQIPPLEAAARQSIYALSVLLARPPADLTAELSRPGPIPAVPSEIPVGLPSELLRRRPDVRQAEALLHAATANIGVATAELFPKFSLTGSMNWQNTLSQKWFQDASRSWSFGPTMNWSFFQGGSIISNIRVQEALRDQVFTAYQQTVLTALQDVENALIAFAKEQEHRKALSDAVTSNRQAVELSMALYTEGLAEFLNVLDAQRSLYSSEDALVQSQRSVATDLIALYKALGGGWETDDAASAGPTTLP